MKYIRMFFIFCFVLSASAYAYNDVDEYADYGKAVSRLETLGVINGYGDGSFRPYEHITREEFAKLVITAVNKTDNALSCGYTSSFSDTPQGEWSVPYINYAAASGMVTGYADGTFKPQSDITYAEAATVILRIMGYNESDLGYFWPNNYVDKANSILLAGSVVADYNAPISRSTAALMIDNALFSDVNGSAEGRESSIGLSYEKDKTVLEASGYKIKDDVFIVASSAEDPNLPADKVRTSDGTYKSKDASVFKLAGVTGKIVINKDDDLALFIPKESRSKSIIVDKITGNQVEYTTSSGEGGMLTLENGFLMYDEYEKTTFGAVSQKLTQGSTVTLYSSSDNGWDLGMVTSTASNIIPVIASHKYTGSETDIEGIKISDGALTVYKDSKTAALSDIDTNDVIYYNKGANIAEVYSKKVTGIYYEAKPGKAYVESIVLGNVEYEIGTTAAKSKLNATASAFEIGDRITLLLGKNDEIAGVISADSSDSAGEYGIVLNVSKKTEKTGEVKYIAKIFTKDEKTTEIITDDYYDDLKGELVRLSYDNGTAKLTKISNGSRLTFGDVDKASKKIGDYSIGSSTLIAELVSNNSGADAKLNIIDFDMLEEKKLSSENVKGIVTNDKFGDVSILYVTGWTDASNTFALVTKVGLSVREVATAENESKSVSDVTGITLYTNAGEYVSLSASYGVKTGDVIKYSMKDGEIDKLSQLKLIKSGSSVQASEMGRIKVGGTVYETSKNVMIIAYDSNTRECRDLSADALEEMKIKSIKLYGDSSSASSKNLVKVIIVTE